MSTATSAADITQAASAFIDALSDEQRQRTIYDFMDGERIFWYYPPVNRHGLPLRDMSDDQRQLALALMRSGLSDRAARQAEQIIQHELILGQIEDRQQITSFRRDPDLYYWTVFGDPKSDGQLWGWRVEGHHISLNFALLGDQIISATPLFLGANPAEVRDGPQQGLRILDQRADLAFDLMQSLDPDQRERAVIYDDAPWDILTFNSSRAVLPGYQGLPAADLDSDQQAVLQRLAQLYINQLPADVAEQRRQRFADRALPNLHWAWAGPDQAGEPHYYRIHGGDFLVEYDNRQNGANHIHSVWRDIENDFAADILRDNQLLFTVL